MNNCPRCQLAIHTGVQRCPRCGAELHSEDLPALVDNRYAIQAELGHGAMGNVYLARDTGLGRRVAIKFIAPQLARDERIIERFHREAGALASIRSEHVVQVYAFGREGASYFFAMEYVEGKTLNEIIENYASHGAKIPVAEALSILVRIARGLEAIHAAGLLHRDIKPDNISIECGTGRPVLLDLGLVKPLTSGKVNQTEIAGTPPYMAPEQIVPSHSPDGLGACTDVYALGCTAYELLTGQTPFSGGSIYEVMHHHLTAPPPRPSALRPELAPLDGVLLRAMAKAPADRFPSARAFELELERAASVISRAAARVSPNVSTRSPRQDRQIRLLVVDDDPLIRHLLTRAAQRTFNNVPLEVLKAGSGIEAVEIACSAPPDLIVLDYDMPGMNGVETLGLLRSQPGVGQVPAIVVTGHGEHNIRWRFELLGVTEYLTKPVSLDAIVGAFERSVASR